MQPVRRDTMSKKSRKRKEQYRIEPLDDYYSNGIFEMARFGQNTIIRNNRTPEEQAAQMEYLCTEYDSKYEDLNCKIKKLKDKVIQCDPYTLLMHLRSMALLSQMNLSSEIDYSSDANAIIHAQEFVQSIIVSAENKRDPNMSDEEEASICEQVIVSFEELYKEILFFYHYWAAHIQEATGIDNERLSEIVESQYMYWVRGNRYQAFELEPLKSLLPPHDSILQDLFGVSASDIIEGLEKLRYALSQGFADAFMELGKMYDAFVQATEDGISPEIAYEANEEHTTKLAGKILGSDLINVKAVTDWDDRFIEMLSLGVCECSTFGNEPNFPGWPIVELPVQKKPFIKLNGTAYAFLYYALFDNIYRNIQRGILQRKPEYLEDWKKGQTKASEEMVKNLFLKLLPGAEAHVGNYYPVKTSLKQMNENDIIILYQSYLFIIEVKAGSFPTTPPITDFNAHIMAYHKLAEEADSQCSRTLDYIKQHSLAQFYDQQKNATFQLQSFNTFDDVFTFSVTVDNFNEFAAKAEKMSVISLKEETVVVSYDDLLAYSGYFDSPIVFLHYLKQRKAAMHVPQFQMNDEFDHLGLYIDRNLYALNPSQYGSYHKVIIHGFRQKLDEYFNWLYTNPANAKKPTQNIPKEISEIIQYAGKNISPDSIRLAHFLLDLSTDAKEDLAAQIKHVLIRQRELNFTVPMTAFGEIKYCAFVTMPGIPSLSEQAQLDYTYAAASRNETVPVMYISLEYDRNNRLVSAKGKLCIFSDLSEEEAERIKTMGNEKAKDWVNIHRRLHGKIGRNDYCPCGSGKKYKNCCLKTFAN